MLGANYPGTDWYAHAYKLMQNHPVKELAAVQTGTQIVAPGAPGTQGSDAPKTVPKPAVEAQVLTPSPDATRKHSMLENLVPDGSRAVTCRRFGPRPPSQGES